MNRPGLALALVAAVLMACAGDRPARGQAVTLPMQPGDVLFNDPATSQPYIWLHANTGRMELLPPYTSEQAFRLLLDREQSVWDILGHVASEVTVAGCPAGR